MFEITDKIVSGENAIKVEDSDCDINDTVNYLYFEYKNLFSYKTDKPCLVSTRQGLRVSLLIIIYDTLSFA